MRRSFFRLVWFRVRWLVLRWRIDRAIRRYREKKARETANMTDQTCPVCGSATRFIETECIIYEACMNEMCAWTEMEPDRKSGILQKTGEKMPPWPTRPGGQPIAPVRGRKR